MTWDHTYPDPEIKRQALKEQNLREHRRFEAAKAAMQGLITLPPEDYDMDCEEVAADAVLYADALLARLEKQ